MRYRVEWGDLEVREATMAEVEAHAGELAAAYNEPHNRAMMGNEREMSPAEVIDHWRGMEERRARQLLFFRGGELIGDADFRRFEGDRVEFAILVGRRAEQGRGLGTRFTVMAHALAFRMFGVARVFVTIVPGNAASRRMFEKVGYRVDDSAEARSYIDAESDLSLSIDRAAFERAHAATLGEIAIATRAPS